MAKKKTEKAPEPKEIKSSKIKTFLKSETTHFVVGLISVIFAVYLLLAFTSFFFTGAADQSILDNQQPGELMQTGNQVKNYAGARGAQLSEYLINNCFGLAGSISCRIGYENDACLPIPYLEMVHVLFYFDDLVFCYVRICL